VTQGKKGKYFLVNITAQRINKRDHHTYTPVVVKLNEINSKYKNIRKKSLAINQSKSTLKD
jgi:hypothetical protein